MSRDMSFSWWSLFAMLIIVAMLCVVVALQVHYDIEVKKLELQCRIDTDTTIERQSK